MVNLERSLSTSTHQDPNGGEYSLVSERIAVAIGGGHAWAGAAYSRPAAIIRHGRTSPIIDAVMVVRLVALLAISLAAMIGTLRR